MHIQKQILSVHLQSVFMSQIFQNGQNFFPAEENKETVWMGFLEIKDCKPKNIVQYKDKTKEQIISTVRLFREKGILSSGRIYGLISFPRRKKVAFDQTIFEDVTAYKRLYKTEHIHFFAVNEIVVNDKSVLSTSKE